MESKVPTTESDFFHQKTGPITPPRSIQTHPQCHRRPQQRQRELPNRHTERSAKVKVPPTPNVKPEGTSAPKTTRLARFVEEVNIERKFFVSRLFELGEQGQPDLEEKNKYVIKLINIALLFALELTKSPKSVCRLFNLNQARVTPKSILIQDGIQFGRCPDGQQLLFGPQVGSGAHAICCFVVAADDASICALKIFQSDAATTKETVDAELKELADRSMFTRTNKSGLSWLRAADGKHILVLPAFSMYRAATERFAALFYRGRVTKTLCSGKQPLDGFASQGYTYNDLKWHHVGTLTTTTTKKRSREGASISVTTTEAFLLDLSDISEDADMRDPEKRAAAWVEARFGEMKLSHDGEEKMDNGEEAKGDDDANDDLQDTRKSVRGSGKLRFAVRFPWRLATSSRVEARNRNLNYQHF